MHSLNALLRPVVDAIPRRALLRLGLGGVVGAVAMSREDAAGKRKKKPCLPCRQRKKGKCKVVQPDGTACPEGVCQAGVCGPKAPASPETRLDATCTGPADPDDFFDVEGNRFAQAFTPLTGGALVQAELVISKVNGSTGDFIVHLVATDNAGFPTDSVLASALLVNQDVAPGSAPRTFAFATPAQVVAGVTYALVLRRTDLGRLQVSHLATPTCGGQAFISNPVTLGYNALPDDLIFRTFIRS